MGVRLAKMGAASSVLAVRLGAASPVHDRCCPSGRHDEKPESLMARFRGEVRLTAT
jgi:hypothetical protein